MIPRHAAPRILRLLQGFPVVTISGPRQSGKTTLVRALLPNEPYISLEAPSQREFARSQPWLLAFLVAYAERDARQLAAIQDLSAVQRFLKLTASRTGQLLNMQSLASDAGISDKTVKSWLSILETCYLIHYVRPHFANFGKRLVKQPKLYMTDVGLAAALIGIQTESQAQAHPLRGALFETMVVNESQKMAKIRGRTW
jgi:predicted AAA+ superfamily ATPase